MFGARNQSVHVKKRSLMVTYKINKRTQSYYQTVEFSKESNQQNKQSTMAILPIPKQNGDFAT